jgi:hypothetical protein
MSWSTDRDKVMASTERDKFGCIVTVRHRETGEMYSFHRAGTAERALREIVETCIDRFFDEDWRVCCISTPVTVYTGLRGARLRGGKGSQSEFGANPLHIESLMLNRIGRSDLLPDLNDPPMTLRRNAC